MNSYGQLQLREDQETARQFFDNWLRFPNSSVEVRVLQGNADKTTNQIGRVQGREACMTGRFVNSGKLISEACRVHHCRVCVLVNPIPFTDTYPKYTWNRLGYAKKEHYAKKDDISVIRNLIVDVDPVRHGKQNSTEEEHNACMEKAKQIVMGIPSLPLCACYGSSGNGSYILIPLDKHNNDEAGESDIRRFLYYVKEYFSDSNAEIDLGWNVTNMLDLPGTTKYKYPAEDETHPYRRITCQVFDQWDRRRFNLSKWINRKGVVLPAAKPAPLSIQAVYNLAERMRQARLYLDKVPGAISGQGGSTRTFGTAAALIHGFALDEEMTFNLLSEWNLKCVPPWTDKELEHKIHDAKARAWPDGEGSMLSQPRYLDSRINDSLNEIFIVAPEFKPLPASEFFDDPALLTNQFIASNITHSRLCSHAYRRSEFNVWTGAYYRTTTDSNVTINVLNFMNTKYNENYHLQKQLATKDDSKPPKKKYVSVIQAGTVVALMKSKLAIGHDNDDEPLWVVPPTQVDWKAQDMISFNDRLIHVPSYIEGRAPFACIHTPCYFTTNTLGYSFGCEPLRPDEELDPPLILSRCLADWWGSDTESVDCFQEILGYLMVPWTMLQKLFMIIGPKRSGKGTMGTVIKNICGRRKVVPSTIEELAQPFGLQDFPGKNVAIFSESRLPHLGDYTIAVERALAISGEDLIVINQKYKSYLLTKLNTRLVMFMNALPSFSENSGALVARAVIVKLTESFIDREDTELSSKLTSETPEIARWALCGLRRLYRRGHFKQPESALPLLDEFTRTTSPVSAFLEDCAEIGTGQSCLADDLFRLWYRWSRYHRERNIGSLSFFTNQLRSRIPNLRSLQVLVKEHGKTLRRRKYIGVGIKDDALDHYPEPIESTHFSSDPFQ